MPSLYQRAGLEVMNGNLAHFIAIHKCGPQLVIINGVVSRRYRPDPTSTIIAVPLLPPSLRARALEEVVALDIWDSKSPFTGYRRKHTGKRCQSVLP